MDLVLQAVDGHEVGAFVEKPKGKARGCVVVLHEAFGVTPHIKSVCADYAGQGYVAVAPHLFSWALGKAGGTVLGQDKDGLDEGRRLIGLTSKEQIIETVRLCVDWARAEGLKTAVVGYCWGGSCSYLAAANIKDIVAASCYYGGWLWEIVAWGQPECPRMVHLARLDRYIPLEKTIAAFSQYDPGCPVFAYDADHGFNRDDGKTYEPEAARLARERTLEMFERAFSLQS